MTCEVNKDTALPYAEFVQRPGEKLNYTIDWTGWLVRYWHPATEFQSSTRIRPNSSTGLQYQSAGGVSGQREPKWPTTVGGTVVDGSITWTAQAIDTNSLESTISTVQWAADTGLTVTSSLNGQRSTVLVDSASAVAGQNYFVTNTVTLTNGEIKKGRLLIQVRD